MMTFFFGEWGFVVLCLLIDGYQRFEEHIDILTTSSEFPKTLVTIYQPTRYYVLEDYSVKKRELGEHSR
jgi:hypothetical protein